MSTEPKKITVPQLVVLISRDSTVTIPVTCFEYELPVLEEIHGEENVTIDSQEDVEVDAFNAAEAYQQLQAKYPQHLEAIRIVYRSPKALAKETGLAYEDGDDNKVRKQSATVVHHDKKPAATKKAATKAE